VVLQRRPQRVPGSRLKKIKLTHRGVLEPPIYLIVYPYSDEPENHLPTLVICMASRRTVMSHAFVGRATFKTIAVVVAAWGLAAFLPALAQAGPSFPSVLGLATLPLRMMTQGVLPQGPGVARTHRHTAHAQSPVPIPTPAPAALEPAAASPVPAAPAPSAQTAHTPPSGPVTIEARAEPAHVTEPPPPAQMPPPLQPALEPALEAPWPIASPSVYADLLGYVLLPGDYADRLWVHGYGDIINTLLAPAAADPDQAAGLIQNGMCSSKASELADQLIARTGALIVPTPEQKAALDELGSALGLAIERGRAAVCTGSGNPLKRMQDGLWIMWDATLLTRAPLEKFYQALTDTQKAKLLGGASAGEALARACAGQAESQPGGSGGRLEQAFLQRPGGADPQQRLMFETLRQQSAAVTRILATSCPRQAKPTPMDRLEAAGERMNTMLYVAMSLSPALAELQQPNQR
jgi:hypothetical protein